MSEYRQRFQSLLDEARASLEEAERRIAEPTFFEDELRAVVLGKGGDDEDLDRFRPLLARYERRHVEAKRIIATFDGSSPQRLFAAADRAEDALDRYLSSRDALSHELNEAVASALSEHLSRLEALAEDAPVARADAAHDLVGSYAVDPQLGELRACEDELRALMAE